MPVTASTFLLLRRLFPVDSWLPSALGRNGVRYSPKRAILIQGKPDFDAAVVAATIFANCRRLILSPRFVWAPVVGNRVIQTRQSSGPPIRSYDSSSSCEN